MNQKHLPPSQRYVLKLSTARKDFSQLISRVYHENAIFLIRKNKKVLAQIKRINYRKYTPPITKEEIDWESQEKKPQKKVLSGSQLPAHWLTSTQHPLKLFPLT